MSYLRTSGSAKPTWNVSIHDVNSPRRLMLEDWICTRFRDSHDANIEEFMPKLLVIEDVKYGPLAVAGIRAATSQPLFLEQYLASPVEQVLADQSQRTVRRESIVEIGNLAARSLAALGPLFYGVDSLLRAMQFDWAVFTATSVVRPGLERAGFPLLGLGSVDSQCIPGNESWGTYYECAPRLTAICHQDVLLAETHSERLAQLREDCWSLGRKELADDAA